MNRLLIKIILFGIPFLLLFVSFIYIDRYKVFREYKNYDTNTNRSYVCYKTFVKNYKNEQFDSFILGSSLSLSFKLSDWYKHLPKNSKPFHFDGSGEGIYGIYNKLKFLDKKGVPVNNVLIIIEKRGLSKYGIYDSKGVLGVAPPKYQKNLLTLSI